MRLIDISEYEWKEAEIQWVERNDYSISLRHMPLYKIPTVDAAPVVHGKWEVSEIPCEEYKCSNCGGGCWYYDHKADVAKSNYCPNCGAKMDGGDSDG